MVPMLSDGTRATAKCKSCDQVKAGATFKVGWMSVHLCRECIGQLRNFLHKWYADLA